MCKTITYKLYVVCRTATTSAQSSAPTPEVAELTKQVDKLLAEKKDLLEQLEAAKPKRGKPLRDQIQKLEVI